jgi:hypothetical protein
MPLAAWEPWAWQSRLLWFPCSRDGPPVGLNDELVELDRLAAVGAGQFGAEDILGDL